jgi:hypothetical protein
MLKGFYISFSFNTEVFSEPLCAIPSSVPSSLWPLCAGLTFIYDERKLLLEIINPIHFD